MISKRDNKLKNHWINKLNGRSLALKELGHITLTTKVTLPMNPTSNQNFRKKASKRSILKLIDFTESIPLIKKRYNYRKRKKITT